MDSARKDVEFTFRMLKKRFIFLKTPIEMNTLEGIEAAFFTCAMLRNWLNNYDGWDDWEGKAGLSMKEDLIAAHDPLDECNRSCSDASICHGFTRHFTWSEVRRLNAATYSHDGDCENLVSEREI